jgi:hypothetical protein
MSNLYVRLHSSFWTHRKTLQLRRKLGDAAFWIPPRLWSFAAENAPDGDLSNYQAEDLAMLVQYSGNAQEMLQALHEAGFLENGVIRNWEERNSFHVINHDRARKAAEARWAKRNEKLFQRERDMEKEKEKERKQASPEQCLTDAPSIRSATERPRVRFVPPTREELDLEAAKLALPSIEVDKFVNYYASKGWKVGTAPMKSWTHALAGWAARVREKTQTALTNDPIARRNALLGDDVAEQQAQATRISRAKDEAAMRRFEETGLTPWD